MRVKFEVTGSLEEIMKDEKKLMGVGLTAAVSVAAGKLKMDWRNQITSAGLSQRLANSIRSAVYPLNGYSYTPAARVYANANGIIDAFDRGAVIVAKGGGWLAIPTKEAGLSTRGGRITPAEWQARRGRTLRLVVTRGGRTAFLVADDAKISKRGFALANNRKRRKDGIVSGSQTVPIFILVPQVKLRKRLDLDAATLRVAEMLPGLVVKNWK